MSLHHLEKSKGLTEQAVGVHYVLLGLLHVVLREVHEVHQQACLYHHRYYCCFDCCIDDTHALIHHLMLLLRRIFVAIYAYSFCHAARKAFFLLLRNFLRVSAVSMVSGFVLLIGKVPHFSFSCLVIYLTILVDDHSIYSC